MSCTWASDRTQTRCEEEEEEARADTPALGVALALSALHRAEKRREKRQNLGWSISGEKARLIRYLSFPGAWPEWNRLFSPLCIGIVGFGEIAIELIKTIFVQLWFAGVFGVFRKFSRVTGSRWRFLCCRSVSHEDTFQITFFLHIYANVRTTGFQSRKVKVWNRPTHASIRI